jgi:hypothetical protein
MKNLNLIISLAFMASFAFPGRVVVGVLERITNTSRYDYYYTVSTGDGSERELKGSMEIKLKRNASYNWMTDAVYAHVGYKGYGWTTILEYQDKFGIGFGQDKSESTGNAVSMLESIFFVNQLEDYEVVYSENLSSRINTPPERPDLLFPKNESTVSTENFVFRWSSRDDDDDDLTFELLLGLDYNNLQSVLKNYVFTSFHDYTPEPGKKYFWRVAASDGKSDKVWADGVFYTSEKDEKIFCSACNGVGNILKPESYRECKSCNGTGKIKFRSGFYHKCEPPLGSCGGSGKIKVDASRKTCDSCGGSGYLYK